VYQLSSMSRSSVSGLTTADMSSSLKSRNPPRRSRPDRPMRLNVDVDAPIPPSIPIGTLLLLLLLLVLVLLLLLLVVVVVLFVVVPPGALDSLRNRSTTAECRRYVTASRRLAMASSLKLDLSILSIISVAICPMSRTGRWEVSFLGDGDDDDDEG